MKRLSGLCCLVLVAFSSLKAQQIILTPKWTAQAQFAGYYVASELGYYKEEGLDLRVQHPSISESSFSFLEKGRAQVVVMNLSQALIARVAGARVVNIMQTSQTNSLMLVSYTPFAGVASLKDKTIAVWNHLSQDLLEKLARNYNLNIKWIRFNNGVNLFLSKAVNICLVGSYNEYPQLEEFGANMDSVHVMRFSDYGYDLPEDGLYVTEDFYKAHPDVVQKIVRASVKGWKYANDHREKALDIVMEEVRKGNIGTNRYHQRRMLEEILRLQCKKGTEVRTFKLDKEAFDRSMKCLFGEGKGMLNMTYQDFVK